jgi:Flp pilus assembly secretin CpaC
MKKIALSTIAAFVVGGIVVATAAKAEVQTISVGVDQSQILQLPAMPGAIVIGNPAIADVSIQGQKLFVHGRSFGQTSLTILDLQGNQMANFNLVGRLIQDDMVTLYRRADRFTLSCSGTCNPYIQVGDQPETFRDYSTQITTKFNIASGSPTAETKAPDAPQ